MRIFIGLMVVFISISCAQTSTRAMETHKEVRAVDFFPDTFADVLLGTYDVSPCSPRPPFSEWSGVIIAAPRRVFVKNRETPVIPICGYYLLPVLETMDGPGLTLHVTQAGSQAPISAQIADEVADEPEIPPPADAPEPSREALEGVSTGGYFNVDAQRYLPKALQPGSYEISVSYAGHHSNPVHIDIIEAAPENHR